MTDRVACITSAARALLAPTPTRIRRVLEMAMATRWSQPMAEWILEATLAPLTNDEEVAAWAAAGKATGRYTGRSVVVAGGPVPDPGVRATAAAVLLGGTVEVKIAAAEPVLLPAFVEALQREGKLDLQVHRFRGGHAPEAEARLYGDADRVLAFGRFPTMQALRAMLRSDALLLAHGPRLSLGLILDESDDRGLRGLALDVARYDQRGCLSPQAVLVQGELPQARRVVQRLGEALAGLAPELPPVGGELAEEAARRQLLDRAVLHGIAAGHQEDHHTDGETYLVYLHQTFPIPLSPGGRVLAVLPVPDLRACDASILGPAAGLLQGVAVVGDDHRKWSGFGDAHLTAPAGELQTPPLHFRPDGLDPFAVPPRPGSVDGPPGCT